jgi:hypothetical protein
MEGKNHKIHKSLLSFLIITVFAIIFSCDKNAPEPMSTRDTLDLSVDFYIGAQPYSFKLKPGDDETSDALVTYRNSGSQSHDLSFTVGSITSYIEIRDKQKNVALKIGFYFRPERIIKIGTDEKCQQLEEESDKYFMVKSYPLCDSWGSGDFLQCTNGTKNEFYFQVEFIDNNTNKEYKSGIQPASGSYFKINRIQKLRFHDTHTSTGYFDWVIEGEFNVTLHAYRFGFQDDPNAESINIEDAHFKIGMSNLCQ